MAVKSPCIGVCHLSPETGICSGCYRDLGEIGAWRDASDGERKRILARAKSRRQSAKPGNRQEMV